MLNEFPIRKTDMPADMRALLTDYPRDSWEAHPGFKDKTRHWLGAHQMFRHLGETLRTETEGYLEGSCAADEYAAQLSYYGNALVRNLHGHHRWEDSSYFPELSTADPRFDSGLVILEKDHEAMNIVLDEFTKAANRVIKLVQLDEKQAREDSSKLHSLTETIENFLKRHLNDEEELAIPIILHHRLRG